MQPVGPSSTARREHAFNWSLYNPGQLARETLIERFLIRHELLEELVRQVRIQPDRGGLRHILCIGQRGMGKTTLLRRLCYFIEDDPELRTRWHPFVLAEEQYQIADLADFFTEIWRQLACSSVQTGNQAADSTTSPELGTVCAANSIEIARQLLTKIDAECVRLQRRVVLLVDNLNDILGNLPELEAHELRRILQENANLLIVGAAPTHFQQIAHYDRPFFDFFRMFRLPPLSDAELDRFLRAVAEQQQDQVTLKALDEQTSRTRSLRLLTGGNPRIALFLYRLIAETPNGDIRQDLDRLLDEVTPYYKHRIDALPKLQRKIIAYLAGSWRPVAETEIVSHIGGSESETLGALRVLLEDGMLERLPDAPAAYQLAERMCNIYYLMRSSRTAKQRFEWFVEFLQQFYEQERLPALAQTWVSQWMRNWIKSEQYGVLATNAQIRDHATSLSLIAQATDSPSHRAAIFAEMMRFMKLAGMSDPVALKVVREHLTDIVTSAPSQFETQLISLLDRKIFPAAPEDAQVQEEGREEALKAARRQTEEQPLDPLGWGDLAVCQARCGDYMGALQSGRHAVSLGNRAIDMRFAMARACVELNQIGEGAQIVDGLERTLTEGEPSGLSYVWELRGLLADRKEDWAGAAEAFRTACKLGPAIWHHHWCLGLLCLNRLNNPREAAEALSRAVELRPTQTEGWRMLATAQLRLRRYAEAVISTERALALNPNMGDVWANLAAARLMNHDAAGALMAGERAVKESPMSPSAWGNLAAAAMRATAYVRAEEAAKQCIQLDAANVTGHVNLAHACLVQGRVTEALAELEIAAHLYGVAGRLDDETAAWMRVSDGLLASEEWALGELALQQVITRAPESATAWHNLGFVYERRGRYAEAVTPLRRSTELDPAYSQSWHALGGILHKLGHLQEAMTVLTEAQRLEPSDQSESLLIDCLLSCQELNRAEVLLDQRVERGQRDAVVLFQLALLRLMQKRPAEAMHHCRQGLELAPDHLSGLSIYGSLCIASGEGNNALAAFRRAVELDPNLAANWLNLATAAEMQRLPDEAAKALRRFLILAPNAQGQRVQLINVLLAAKDFVRAEEEFKAYLALAIEPAASVYNTYAILCMNHGALERASEALEEAVRLDPKSALFRYNLAGVYLHMQRLEEAWESFRCGLEADPSGGTEQRWVSMIATFLTKPDPQTGLRLASMGLVQHPESNRLLLQLAWAQLLCGHSNQALSTLLPHMQRAPESPEGWMLLACIFLQEGAFDLALQSLQETLRFLDSASFELAQGTLLSIVQQLARRGFAAQLITLIQQSSHLQLGERWQALRLALEVSAHGSIEPFSRAPQELRVAAQQIFAWIWAPRTVDSATASVASTAETGQPKGAGSESTDSGSQPAGLGIQPVEPIASH